MRAEALEPENRGPWLPLHTELTVASSLLQHVDNRNSRPASVERAIDDDWSAWYNRLNLQVAEGRWHAGLRLDTALFPTSPDPTEVALGLTASRRGAPLGPPYQPAEVAFFRAKLREAGTLLSNRYINWTYPVKYYLGYDTEHLELMLGDAYAQFGRGLVLSLRKEDELAHDTTLRGLRTSVRARAGGLGFKLTGLGGVANPLRIDEASGRYLSVDDGVTGGELSLLEAGMPRTIETDFVPNPSASYAPDRLFGLALEGGSPALKLGAQGSLLERQDPKGFDLVRSADVIRTGSLSLEAPSLGGLGSAYVEFAGQALRHADAPDNDLDGHGIYMSLVLLHEPLSLTFEGRHYRALYPLFANVDIGQAPEWSELAYSAPPTTEAVWVDSAFSGFNTCVSGGRAKSDVQVGAHESVFFWVGHYQTWAESVANERCEISDESLNRVFDAASGVELTSRDHRSRGELLVGARVDTAERELAASRSGSHQFYRENYLRYEITRSFGGPFSLELYGWHRRRLGPESGPLDTYYQGQHTTGFGVGDLSIASSVEFDTDPGTPDLYLSGQVRYALTSTATLAVFGGQRRGGLRCVSGVCRVFPPFEGGRIDFTWRL